ncbi:hypothetical protein CR513_10234, partial [Mucuna pruriens]
MGTAKKERLRRKTQSTQWIQLSLYHHFTSGGIISPYQIAGIGDQLPMSAKWVHLIAQELDNWMVEALPNLVSQQIRQDEREGPEEEALIELKRMIERERLRLQFGTEDLEVINLGGEEETWEIRVGKQVPSDLRQRLVELLKEYADIFAWSYRDIPALDIAIVKHRLPLVPNAIPVRQQLRRMKPEWNAGFLAVVEYPQWVANIVPIPKKDGKIWMCVDYRDLNKESPKDNFPLPHIHMLVDNTAQHTFYSLMDGFSGYNQIRMALEDKEKTTFITT